MNIRDLKLNDNPSGAEDLVLYGVDPLLQFADLLRQDLEEDYQHGDPISERRLFYVEEMRQRLKDVKDCLRRFDAKPVKDEKPSFLGGLFGKAKAFA